MLYLYGVTFTLASRSVGEPALPSCTFISAADGPLPVLEVGDVRLFSHEFDDGLLQAPAAIASSAGSDLFCKRNGGHCRNYIPRRDSVYLKSTLRFYFLGRLPLRRAIIATNANSAGPPDSLSRTRPLIRQRAVGTESRIPSGFPSRGEYLISAESQSVPKAILRRGPSDGPWRTDRFTWKREATRGEAVSERLGSNL